MPAAPADLDQEKFIRSLFLNGAFWNIQNQDTLNVTQDDLPLLTIDHPLVKKAILSWQSADANFNVLSFIFHLRSIIHEAEEIGPVTQIMIGAKRCPMPDHPPPPTASFDYGIPDLNEAVKSYQEWAEYVGGSGSWPKCDPQRPDVHSTRVNLTTTSASAHQKSILKETVSLVEKCEAEYGQSVRHIFDGDPEEAEHDVRFELIPGNVIGYCYFPKPNTCNQIVQCRIDNSFNPNVITFANLLEHEYKGHGDGLEHTNGGIMNPSIITIDPMTWKGDKSESIKRRYFGGVPIPPGPTNPPPDPTDPVDHNGIVVIDGKLYKSKFWLA